MGAGNYFSSKGGSRDDREKSDSPPPMLPPISAGYALGGLPSPGLNSPGFPSPMTPGFPSPGFRSSGGFPQSPGYRSSATPSGGLQSPGFRPPYSRNASHLSLPLSTVSIGDETKQQLTLNYLYQQQHNNMWIQDTSGDLEGVMLRKSKGNYIYCPADLGNSPLAQAMSALNVQVSLPLL